MWKTTTINNICVSSDCQQLLTRLAFPHLPKRQDQNWWDEKQPVWLTKGLRKIWPEQNNFLFPTIHLLLLEHVNWGQLHAAMIRMTGGPQRSEVGCAFLWTEVPAALHLHSCKAEFHFLTNLDFVVSATWHNFVTILWKLATLYCCVVHLHSNKAQVFCLFLLIAKQWKKKNVISEYNRTNLLTN